MDRYQKSREYLARASKVTPGAAQTLSKMPARFPSGAFPVVLKRGTGARVWDLDGNEYVDWICGLGAMTLGYSKHFDQCDALFPTEDPIINAVASQLFHYGQNFSLPHELECTLSERLCEKIPCAEMVRFVNSGSESTQAAIRTARISTGRDIILTVKAGYHGWFSDFQCVKDWRPGIPELYTAMVGTFEYNNLPSLAQAFEDYRLNNWQLDSDVALKPGVAAVILEPCLFDAPAPGFLQGVRDLCTKHNALLIFDEMVTGFRWALAGGQEYFGMTPDLATYGKGMANGFPIGMLCGKREYMQHAELISGTFGGNAVSLAAANAVLDVYEQKPIIATMWQRGRELQDYFNATAINLAVPAVCDGYACKPRIKFTCEEPQRTQAMSLFLQEAALFGALFHPGGFNVSAALTDEDMRVTRTAVDRGLRAVGAALRSGDWSPLYGQLCQPVVTVRQ